MIYICIPSHGEEQTIGVLLWKVRQVMAEFQRDYRVLVLDDGSTDRTPSVLEPYLRVMPLTVLRHEGRQGHAPSLERLLREAAARAPYPKRDCVVTLQADFTDDPEHIPDLVKRIEGGIDVVASVARLPAETPRTVRWARAIAARLARMFRRWPAEVSDPLSGYRAYRVICLRKMFEQHGDAPILHGATWTVNAQLLQLVAPEARRVDEINVAPRYGSRRRASRLQPSAAILDFVRFLRNAPVARLGSHAEVEEMQAPPVAEEWAAGTVRRQRGEEPSRRRGSSGGGGRRRRRSGTASEAQKAEDEGAVKSSGGGSRSGRRRKRGARRNGAPEESSDNSPASTVAAAPEEQSAAAADPDRPRRRRRRSRRGGRRRSGSGAPATDSGTTAETPSGNGARQERDQ